MSKIYSIIFIAGLIILFKPAYPSFELNPSAAIEIELISIDELEEIIINRSGKSLLINIWATWCPPCIEEFPDLVKLANEYNDKIDVIGISLDSPEETDSKIIPFLKKHNVTFTNYTIKIIEPEDFINLLNEDWSGAIPATFIYNEKGEQIKYLIGKQSLEEFEKAIETL